jgi:hypothetical protein
MLKGKMDDQLLTSWILDNSQCLLPFLKTNKIFDTYCGSQVTLNFNFERLHLSVGHTWSSLYILSLSACTLKVLDLTVSLYVYSDPLSGICKELEAMAGHNTLEALSFGVQVDVHDLVDSIGSIIKEVEIVLVKPGLLCFL